MKNPKNELFTGTKSELFEVIRQSRPGLDPGLSYDNLPDPFLLQDMDKAVKRIKQALKKNEKIAIYGDYDIDGLTATTLLHDFLTQVGAKEVVCHIPNRFTDGYGLVKTSLKKLKDEGYDLVITVDCGSLSLKEADYAKEIGLDLIITDHHTINPEIPDCVAVINPKRQVNESSGSVRSLNSFQGPVGMRLALDPETSSGSTHLDLETSSGNAPGSTIGSYPYPELAGVGVAFKLAQALQIELGLPKKGQEKWLLDLVALGTVCDVVPLTGENYVLAKCGLQVLRKTKRIGLKHLARVSNVDISKVGADDLGFRFGPRLNASGRLDDARSSLDLLMSDHAETAARLAFDLDGRNTKRRLDQDKIYKAACLVAEEDTNPVLVVRGEDWSHGIVGIVASKLVEKFNKPTFVMQNMGEETKGSGRSFGDYNLAAAVKHATSYIKKGGGHAFAAGVTLPSENFEDFRNALHEYYEQTVTEDQLKFRQKSIDAHVASWSHFDLDFIRSLEDLGPFGMANRRPIFAMPDAVIHDIRPLGQDGKHLKISLKDHSGDICTAVAFNFSEKFKPYKAGDTLGLVKFEVQENLFNGRSSAQVVLVEVA
jgi:single-stranded-DNA-specific exonuclease